jgi:hypothetical protein
MVVLTMPQKRTLDKLLGMVPETYSIQASLNVRDMVYVSLHNECNHVLLDTHIEPDGAVLNPQLQAVLRGIE